MSATIPSAVLHCRDHAPERPDQRNIDHWLVRLVLDFGDLEVRAGRGRTALSISRRCAKRLADRGIPPDDLARAAKLVVVAAAGDGLPIAKAFRHTSRRSRHCRHPMARHRRAPRHRQ